MENIEFESDNQFSGDATLRGKTNWPLIVGLVLVLFILVLAIIGPDIAPKDPIEEHIITMIDGKWYIPPFDMGTPGYPLGSDRFGRDLYSRLLWGIRPTMIMVVIVACVRLFLGVVIGLCAGWFSGKTGRFLDGLIQIALALPILLVALGAIAIVGVELGIWAFIIGLSLTGWVDTALQVREQTRIVKKQVYIEAANALGATSNQILSGHILKQIIPMLLMLFAFELSSTLMLTAGLGFLGYYIGGDVWVETDDFVARRISGAPELGQMLATSWQTLTKPWPMIVVGTTVFLTVLGFNLIGEGLRQNIGFAKVQRKNIISETKNSVGLWLDNFIWHPLVQFSRIKPLRLGLAIVVVFFLLSLGSLLLLDAASQATAANVIALFTQNGSNDKASQDSTPQNIVSPSLSETEETVFISSYDPIISWEFVDEDGFTGGPVPSGDQKRMYLASTSGYAYAFDIEGNLLWKFELSLPGVGAPAVNSAGDIYIADDNGGLNKISADGELIWHFQSEAGEQSHSGPAIASNGNIFYTVGSYSEAFVQSVSPRGEALWDTQAKTRLFFETPEPSSDGQFVFLKDDIFDQETGEYLDLEFDLEVIRYFSGDDGNNYLIAGHNTIQWEEDNGAIVMVDIHEWDSTGVGDFLSARNAGVTEDKTSWQLFTTPGGSTQMVWVSVDDQALGTSDVNISSGNLISLKDNLSALVCGGRPFNEIPTDCALMSPESGDSLWRFHLGNYGPVVGGFYLKDYYYLATEDGHLFQLDENFELTTAGGQSSTSPGDSSSSGAGLLWSYNALDPINFVSQNQSDGMVYLTTEDNKIHIINPDGGVYNVIQLPIPPFHQISDTGRSPTLAIAPVILPDGTIVILSDENSFYAMDKDGEILWEETLVAPPADHPITDQSGNIYFIDSDAALNAIDRDGLKWRFQTEAADIPAHGFVVDENGNIYYVVTDYGKGYIQAVSKDGENLWVLLAETRDFYDDLHLSFDGMYLSLADVLVLTETGEPIKYEIDQKVDEFIFALNGQNFVRSLHSVSEWQLSETGIEILSTGFVSEDDTSLRPPLASAADSNGIVWLYYPERYTGGGVILVWMAPNGELLGNHVYDRNFHTMVSDNLENGLLTVCIWFEDTKSIDCSVYSPYTEEPVGTTIIENIPTYQGGYIDGDSMNVFGEDNTLYRIYLGELTSP